MKNYFEENLKILKEVRMNDKEKSSMKALLLEHVSRNRPIKTPFWVSYRSFLAPAFAVVMLFFGIGSVGVISQSSLPGDFLYVVKRGSEDLRSMVAIGSRAQAEVKVAHTVRRLEEAEKLSSIGKLDTEKEAEIEKSFDKISDETILHISAMNEEAEDTDLPEEILSKFEEKLKTYENTLSAVSSSTLPLKVKAVLFRLENMESRMTARNKPEETATMMMQEAREAPTTTPTSTEEIIPQ